MFILHYLMCREYKHQWKSEWEMLYSDTTFVFKPAGIRSKSPFVFLASPSSRCDLSISLCLMLLTINYHLSYGPKDITGMFLVCTRVHISLVFSRSTCTMFDTNTSYDVGWFVLHALGIYCTRQVLYK